MKCMNGNMSTKEMATSVSLRDDASLAAIPANGLTVITIDSDHSAEILTSNADEKDGGALSEPEELRRSSKRTRTRRSLLFKDKSATGESDHLLTDQLSDGKEPILSATTSEDRKKQRSLWTAPETQAFFEALAEHGKDFQAIQLFIQNKLSPDSSKKNRTGAAARQVPVPGPVTSSSTASSTVLAVGQQPAAPAVPVYEVRTREQVRHFYYRTWHKISATCQFEEVLKGHKLSEGDVASEESEGRTGDSVQKVDKAVLELYGLINYGEIWKKFPSKLGLAHQIPSQRTCTGGFDGHQIRIQSKGYQNQDPDL